GDLALVAAPQDFALGDSKLAANTRNAPAASKSRHDPSSPIRCVLWSVWGSLAPPEIQIGRFVHLLAIEAAAADEVRRGAALREQRHAGRVVPHGPFWQALAVGNPLLSVARTGVATAVQGQLHSADGLAVPVGLGGTTTAGFQEIVEPLV